MSNPELQTTEIRVWNETLENAVYSKPSPPTVAEIAAELGWTEDAVRARASDHYWMWITDDDRIDYDGE